ncbi:hypothetical protein [Mycolicibacterium helvum]|nr:hypothetical protein [Mycolicibacterium helvum]
MTAGRWGADSRRTHRVIVDVSDEHVEDYETQMRIALAAVTTRTGVIS